MNYSGNMPDWHQYNPPQSGINDVTSTAQNVNSGHLSFISSISPTQLNHGLNLSNEGHEKHQNDSAFNPRLFQPQHLPGNISHGHNPADNTSLGSMVQMQNCIGHYGPSGTRNPMAENLNGPMDPRNGAIGGLNDELSYRNNQVPLNGPITHLNGPNMMNMNASHGSIGPRNTNVNSQATNRAAPPSFVSCKGPCCNPEPNIGYQQWEKYCSYQNNTTYRDSIRVPGYQAAEARRFGNDFNFRKDNFDGKEVLPSAIVPNAVNAINADHRRNISDYKHRKDRLLSRSYPSNSGMLQNYPMQNYNYTGEYQKYSYSAKEYPKVNNMNVPSQGIVKHQEQGLMSQQQKYSSNKQAVPYQNNAMMPASSMPSTNVNPSMMPSAQNTYFNPQYPRNLPTENLPTTHDCQEAVTDNVVTDNVSMVNRMQMPNMQPPGPHSRYQMYQQKIAMQRFSMEAQLRELAKVPGYQSHPKYKECLLKYRELLKLQQSVTYQGQIQQQTPCVTASTVSTTSSVPPINLQFDQNGVLINSNYMPEAFPQMQQMLNSQAPTVDGSDKQQSKPESNGIPNMVSHSVQKQPLEQQLVVPQQQHDAAHVSTVLCANTHQKQAHYPVQKNLEVPGVQFEVQQKTGSENFTNLNVSTNNTATTIQQKISKEFANKPELDVRQFLANWDESEDEDGANLNIQNVVLSNSTPVVVVGYENVGLSAKTLEGLKASKPAEVPLGVKDIASKEVAKESLVPAGSIIQCISNGPDDVPTIHIVDNLEIGSILQVTSGQVAEPQEAVSFYHGSAEVETNAIALETDKFKKTDGAVAGVVTGAVTGCESTTAEYSANLESLSKEKCIVESSSSLLKTTDSTSQTSQVSDNRQEELATLAAPAKDNTDNSAQGINLKKQSSFASEESHHPDDISLPDLPTSECTPISTTLNTPIHSDSEEASDRVEDLTIPTNPIEVVQNSPIISFTQSPMRGEPYDHLSDGAGDVKSGKTADSLKSQYQTKNRFNEDASNNMLGHDNILGTFEFPTGTDKNEAAVTAKRDNNKKERSNGSGSNASVDDEGTFALDGGAASAEMTGMRMTLTSGEYELKIVSTGMQSDRRNDKNSTIRRRTSESQAGNNAQEEARKKTRTLSDPDAKGALRNSAELNKALRNITSDSDLAEDTSHEDDGNRHDTYESRLPKATKSEDKSTSILSVNKRRRVPTESSAHHTATTVDSSPADDTASRSSRPAAGDSPSKIVKSSSSTSHSTKHSILSNDRLRKSGKSARGDSLAEGNDTDKSRDSRNSRHAGRHSEQHRVKSTASSGQVDSHGKRPESSAEKCSETTIHHNQHTQEATAHRTKSCAVDDLKEQVDVSRSEPRSSTTSSNVDENRERLRLLKQYRRIKYKSSDVAKTPSKSRDAQEAADYRANKRCHPPASPDRERSASQVPADKQLCQRDAGFKSAEEQERKHVLKTFVSKNVNPDFAIQVTNVNLKLKDNDHQKKKLQYLGEEAKNSGALDAIKIEINVSCTERNAREKLLHENIKNAVAETIGHLTSSISSGARSSSTNLQCDKKTLGDQAADSRDYDRHDRSPSALTDSTYDDDDTVRKADGQDNAKTAKFKSACKDSATNDEAAGSPDPKKKRSLPSEQEVINIYEAKGNVEAESTTSTPETLKSEHAPVRRKSVHQDADQVRKVVAPNFPANIEESKASSDNLPHTGSTSRGGNAQKKEQQESFLCRNARNSQDSVASKLNAGASTSSASGTADPGLEDAAYDNNSSHFDYDHFDVASKENTDVDDKRMDRWKRPRRDDGRFNSLDLYEPASGYMNPIFFSVNELENLNTVPVYTTKDGKITYSPNPRFTYHELLKEARAKEGYSNARDPFFARSPSFDYFNCSKLRKMFKRSNRDVAATARKRENAEPADAKSQFAPKHVDYLANANAHHAKTRNTPHLEFFNDNADKLYTSRSDQQEGKEADKKNIVDPSLLEKQCNPDGESAPNIKHCGTRALAENLDREKGHNDSSVLNPNMFLEPRALSWDETMESVKSYSSHVNRRKSGNPKELNFSEIFSKQKRLDSFPLLHPGQESLDGNDSHKVNNSCDPASELPTLSPRTTPSYTGGNLHLIRDDDSRCEQSDTVAPHEQENTNNNRDHVLSSTDVNDELPSAHNASSYDEYAKRPSTEFDQVETAASIFAEGAPPSCPLETVDDESHVLEKDECSACHVRDSTSMESSARDDTRVPSDEDRPNGENASEKEASDKSPTEVTSPPESSTVCDGPHDEPKCVEPTVEEPTVPVADEQPDEVDDSAKSNSASTANNETVHQRISESVVSVDREDEVEILPPVTESNVATETYFNDETSERDDTCGKENPTLCEEERTIASQSNPPDEYVAAAQQPLDEEDEHKSQKLQQNDKEQLASGNLSKDPGIDEVDDCGGGGGDGGGGGGGVPVLFEPTVTSDLPSIPLEESVCDIFAGKQYEQNISEFTVIKNIIKLDKKQGEEPRETDKTTEASANDSIIIDHKLLCIDSSDCGIYVEDRCTLMQITEPNFTEEDSMVPMQWETIQIQEDAVNRLCRIDESSIDFAAAANSLRSEDNSLLNNLSLSSSALKEPQLLELPAELESKMDEPAAPVVAELTASPSPPPPPVLEKFQTTAPCSDEVKEQREQNPVSSSSYEQVAYLRATDCNANTKIVPKLVIKKNEVSSKFVTKMNSSSSMDSGIGNSMSGLRPSCQPKIPKMIIRNARSRPSTPSIEAVPDEASVSTSERSLITAHETREDPYEDDSESSLQSLSSYRSKIPKMKIKLDVKHASKIVKTDDMTGLGTKRKNMKKTIPKMKIKNSPRHELSDTSIYNSAIARKPRNLERHQEKMHVLKLRKRERNRSSSPEIIPVLKLKRQERNRSSSPEIIRKRHSSSNSDVPSKRYKRSECDDSGGHYTRRSNSDSARTTATECKMKRNATMCTSEKIPKVIIKRTSASAEFKCELSKCGKNVIAKSAKWQPEVKLERYRILDSMAKDLKSSVSLTPVSLRIIDKIFASHRKNCSPQKKRDQDPHKLARSNSTSDLIPAKRKQRRMSDYDCRKTGAALKNELSFASSQSAESKDTKTTQKKSSSATSDGKSSDECQTKDDKRRSRFRDKNSRTEANVASSEKETVEKDRSTVRRSSSKKIAFQHGKCKTDDDCNIKPEKVKMRKEIEEGSSSPIKLNQKNLPKRTNSPNFKTALKELKTENFVKLPSLISSEESEAQTDKKQSKENDPFLCKDDDKIVTKKQMSVDDMDIECTFQDDVSLKEKPVGILNNFEMDNAVIKIESSDDSQTTIEILPASPNDSRDELESHIIDDGDSESLYPTDAIPTQFELELDITDNSNIDVPDVSMPKLNPVACYSSPHASTEDYGNQASKVCRYSKPKPSHCGKNSLGRDKHTDVDLSGDNRPASFECVKEIPFKLPKEEADRQTASKEKGFCCNDSLIKEVLAAKETLKKCLSRSRCESSSEKPKTAAEKKQGSSFYLNSLSEVHPESSNASQGCRTPRTDSVAAASGHHNKTESITSVEKSDKKHSKSSVFVKKRVKPLDKKDEEPTLTITAADSRRRMTENPHEGSTTISLKTFKRYGQTAASHENSPRLIDLSEKRKKNQGDQKITVPRESPRKEENKLLSYKIPKISRPVDPGSNVADSNVKNAKPKEDNMPILEPAVVVSFDVDSDRESSRSPPVITNQDSGDTDTSKLVDNDKVITSDNKVVSDIKDVCKKAEMSIADFVTQLAYHEKATIKHRRYCNLCERWFLNTSRHRRHLAGYQHRHMELTQRRSIHSLFMLFTGNPCSRLMPANVMRNDCSVGELTPLQIAVQDVTKSLDHTEQSPKKQNDK